MSNQLKISADTSQVKKSILDLGKTFKDLKNSKVQIFSEQDKKFMKTEFKKEIVLMKAKLQENRSEIEKMVAEQQKMVSGSKEELEQRKKILESYKIQAKLAKQLGSAQTGMKGISGAGGGMMGSIASFARMIPQLAALAAIGYAFSKGKQANEQFKSGVGTRNKLAGLGVEGQDFGSPKELARVGLTEQEMIQRRVDATATLGKSNVSHEGEMRKAGFERSFGLDGGTMTGISNQLRGSMGGQGANDAQMKLQASVFAAGLEEAIGPYLESATQLLSSINENGTAQTTEMIGLLAQLTKDGERTPELLAKTFASINDSVKGATGESSAFLQAAFARAGIGGGTIGGTKFAMAGGIMGQDRKSLEKRGYNKDLLDNMEKSGQFTGIGKRSTAIMDQIRKSGGLKPGQSLSSNSSEDVQHGVNNLMNSVLGTKDNEGYDVALMLEKVEKKQMTRDQFNSKLKEMQEGKDPSLSRLDKINGTLAGQTEILEKINTNLMEGLGKKVAPVGNAATKLDNAGIAGMDSIAQSFHDASNVDKTKGIAGYGHSTDPVESLKEFYKKRKLEDDAKAAAAASSLTAKEIGKEVANALKENPIINKTNMKLQLPDGNVTDKVQK